MEKSNRMLGEKYYDRSRIYHNPACKRYIFLLGRNRHSIEKQVNQRWKRNFPEILGNYDKLANHQTVGHKGFLGKLCFQ